MFHIVLANATLRLYTEQSHPRECKVIAAPAAGAICTWVQLLPHLHSPPLAQPQPPAAAVLHPQGAFSAVHVQPSPQLQVAPAAGAAADLHPHGEFSAVHVQPSPQLQVAPAAGAAADLHPHGEFSAVHVQPSPQLQVAVAAVLQPQGEFSAVQVQASPQVQVVGAIVLVEHRMKKAEH
ncbi:unnamed protein product [Closterium sp. Naga37s-1]|nr:unnamed protein product [Closterium sp. Naga37s-1]CAI5528047.1 unnamed protein product [Closterium sp. Naga37s-1]